MWDTAVVNGGVMVFACRMQVWNRNVIINGS